jgi:hypothetical protein
MARTAPHTTRHAREHGRPARTPWVTPPAMGSIPPARSRLTALLLAVSVAACGVAGNGGGPGDRPNNPRAVAPFTLVAQGTGPAGDYRVWAFHTSDGMACLEVNSAGIGSGGCDPTGDAPTGGGVGRSAQGVIVDGATPVASAVRAVLRDASGAMIEVTLIDVGPQLPGVKIGVANLGPDANPVGMDFLDAGGSKVDSVRFP